MVLLAAVMMLRGGLDTAEAVQKADPRWIPADLIVDPDAEGPRGLPAIPYLEPGEFAGSPLGQTYLLGTTWYDCQSNGSLGKMVVLSPIGGVHFCWMNGLQAQAVDRHIYYNYWATFPPYNGALEWPGEGYPADEGYRAGYATLAQFDVGYGHEGSEAVIAYHQRNLSPTDSWNTTVAWDFLEGFGGFWRTEIDNLPGWEPLMWPHVAVCLQDHIHVVSCENRTDIWHRIAYSCSEDTGFSYAPFTVVDTLVTISQDVAASPVSNKVGIAYCKPIFDPLNLGPYDGLAVSQRNNDVVLVESEDGSTWSFTDRRNITGCIAPDTSRYPDTTYANGDTLRAYCDVNVMYDQNDQAHMTFTTTGLWFDARLAEHPDSFAVVGMTRDASVIWHWSEQHDTLTVVAGGWYDVGDPDAGANEYRGAGAYRSTVDRPSLGQDPVTGYLYCLYIRCTEGDTSGGLLPSHGFANGELYCSVSADGGLNWSQGTNLTNSPSPAASPGQCMDEDYASLAAVVNDTLHIIYVEDKDAGGVVQTAPQEGTWTENPVRYQRVPADLVPPGPPYVTNFSFHVSPREAVPVTLSSFKAAGGRGSIVLEWITATEVNCHRWEVYRSDLEEGRYEKMTELSGHGSTGSEHTYRWVDRHIAEGVTYFYKLRQIDLDGGHTWSQTVSAAATSAVPQSYFLHQNHPNPFNAATEIRYQLPAAGHVTLKIYNTPGQEVRTLVDGRQPAGEHRVRWDGRDRGGSEAASGLYLCRMEAGGDQQVIKLLLLR